MSMYPSLEDMKMDELVKAQLRYENSHIEVAQEAGVAAHMYAIPPPTYQLAPSAPAEHNNTALTSLYPSLDNYMGLELTEELIAPFVSSQVAVPVTASAGNMVAPLSNQSLAFRKTQVTHGVREATLCKDGKGKIGLRLRAVNNGLFVCLVIQGSPAALAGLRFGDQLLQINGKDLAAKSMDEAHDMLKKCGNNDIKVIVRDRPFERTIVLHKDSTNHVGFQFKNGKIIGLVKDSSAARNGLLTEHQILEVNGQNVVGIKDKELTAVIESPEYSVVTITVMPYCLYQHMISKMAGSLLTSIMDHSMPTF